MTAWALANPFMFFILAAFAMYLAFYLFIILAMIVDGWLW